MCSLPMWSRFPYLKKLEVLIAGVSFLSVAGFCCLTFGRYRPSFESEFAFPQTTCLPMLIKPRTSSAHVVPPANLCLSPDDANLPSIHPVTTIVPEKVLVVERLCTGRERPIYCSSFSALLLDSEEGYKHTNTDTNTLAALH